MNPILVLENDADVPPGYLIDVLETAPGGYELRRLHAGDEVGGPHGWAGVVVLGGAMGVYDADAHPYLHDEAEMLVAAVARDVPVLGICLGCQLLADALGGRAYRAERVEARFETFSSPAASADPAVRELDGPQLTFHQDTWEAPPGVRVLLRSPQYPQAFRFGSAVAIQTHPEVTPEIARGWMESPGGRDMLDAAGADSGEILGRMEACRDSSREMARRFFVAWLAETDTEVSVPDDGRTTE